MTSARVVLTDLQKTLLEGRLDEPGLTVAERLNRLIEEGAGPSTNADVASAVNALGHKIDPSYVSRLRRGERKWPSHDLLIALTQVFEVPVAYWFSEEVAVEVWAARRPAEEL